LTSVSASSDAITWVRALVIAELVAAVRAVAAADPVAEALPEVIAPCVNAETAVLRSERCWPSEPAAPLAKPAIAPSGSCSEVRKFSADGENWLEAVLGAVWAFDPGVLALGKLCPVEKGLPAELAGLFCRVGTSDSRARSAAELFEVVGFITTISSAARPA
jgi:hypothetical protein